MHFVCVCQNMKYLVKNMQFLTLLLWDLSERPFYTTRLTPALFWAHSTHNTNQHRPVFWFVMQHVDPGGSPCVWAALPESFLYHRFYEPLTWRRIQKSSVCPKNPVKRSLDGFQSGMRAVSDAVRASQHNSDHVLFDVNGKNDAAAVILSNLWQSTEGISPLEKRAQTRPRVVLVMSQHVLNVITTNTTLSSAEKLKKKHNLACNKQIFSPPPCHGKWVWNHISSGFLATTFFFFFIKQKILACALFGYSYLSFFFIQLLVSVFSLFGHSYLSVAAPTLWSFFNLGGLQKLSFDV